MICMRRFQLNVLENACRDIRHLKRRSDRDRVVGEEQIYYQE